MTARTTVVVLTHNRPDELRRTLTHLLDLRPRPPIIVVDNASAPGVLKKIRHMVAPVTDVRLIASPNNIGAAGRNLGVVAARTPYVAFCDDDSWWAPDAFAQAEHLFDRYDRLGLIAAKTLVGSDGRVDPTSEAMARSPLGTAPDLPGPSVVGFLACSALVRREAFVGVGGFHPALHLGAEETLLAYDLKALGWELCYVDTVRAHHHPATTARQPARRRFLELRNGLLIAGMRRPWAHVGQHAAALARRAVTDNVARHALTDVARRLPAVVGQRRRLPDDVERQVRDVEVGR